MEPDIKRANFQRLVNKRVPNVVHALRVLAHCSNKSAYSYHPKEVKKIFDYLREELAETEKSFATKYKTKFSL